MRSKLDPVDQPERTAHYDCAMCIAEMLHNRDSSVNIPLPPDQHHCSDEAKWRLGRIFPMLSAKVDSSSRERSSSSREHTSS